ncbi:hypothetical protein LTS10_000018 [Elasticomyces elasticus]|nr:hypothetical protein LTS10_000018 [Elasticomyces elasticus]
MYRRRTWFMIPFVLGGIFETFGFIGRTLSATEQFYYTPGPYVTQYTLLLIAPALHTASIYVVLARIVAMVKGEEMLFIRRAWFTKLLVSSSVLSFLLQVIGSGIILRSWTGYSYNSGKAAIIAGLAVQIVSLGMYISVVAMFYTRLALSPTQCSYSLPCKKHVLALGCVSILIFIRSIVRMVDYLQGWRGLFSHYEVFFYVFDAAMILIAMAILNIIHTGEVKEHSAETLSAMVIGEGSEGKARKDDYAI